MRLALVIDDYLPYSTRVGAKMFHEFALELLNDGHHVTVITPGIEQRESLVVDDIEGVSVWRFSSAPIKDVGKVVRAINETLLSFRAWSAVRSRVKKDTFDGVVYYSPSIFFGGLVMKLKRRCNCNSYLVLRDLFPQWVIDSGLVRSGSLVEKYFRYFENLSYRQADAIGLMSQNNLDVFETCTESLFSAHVLRNWASLTPHVARPKRITTREKLNLKDKVIFFYGGNIGHAQDMTNLMRLAKGMQPYPNAHFLFVGQGDEVGLIHELADKWELTNFSYLPSVTQDEFKEILSDVDVGLFSLSEKHTAHNFPGKLLGYMVQSLPILGSVNPGNDLEELVNNSSAGRIHVNGKDDDLLGSAIELYNDKPVRDGLGKAAFELLEREFSVARAVQTVCHYLRVK